MNRKIKIYELLEMINNLQRPMPKKINCCGYEYEWDSDFQDYLRTDHKQGLTFSFLENHDDNLYCFLNDEIEILDDEDMEIKIINSLNNVGNSKELAEFKDKQQLNNHILKDKINELVREINKLKKDK